MKRNFLSEFGNVPRRVLSFLLALVMVLGMCPVIHAAEGTTLYLKPNTNWLQADARFAAYCFEGENNTWVDASDEDADGYYEAVIPEGYSNVIFCRMNPGTTENNWDNRWNQTADLTVPSDGTNCYSVAEDTWDNGGGDWSVYGAETEPTDPPAGPDYYLIGYINGANYGCEEDWENLGEYKFAEGRLTVAFEQDSYVFVKTGDNANWYLAESYCTETTVTLARDKSEKMFVPGGVELIFTLVENEDGTLTLSYETVQQQEPAPAGTYYVAGVPALCGSEWNCADAANLMTWNAEAGVFEKVYSAVAAGTYQFKVTDGTWDNNWGDNGNNYTFEVSSACDVTITFDPDTKTVNAFGDGVGEVAGLEIESITVVGNGSGSWLNGCVWDVAAAVNHMSADGAVYTITYEAVAAGSYEFKFAANDSWNDNWGSNAVDYTGDDVEAVYNGQNILLTVGETSDVTLKLDLTNFDYKTKTGAVWSVDRVPTETETTDPTDPVLPVEGTTVTLRFCKTEGWGDTIRAWIWDDSGNSIAGYEQYHTAWPGSPIEADTENPGWYIIAVTTEEPMAFNFIFNDGASQTTDLSTGEITGDTELWVVGNSVYTEKPVPQVTIHFLKPDSWKETIHAYAWDGVDLGSWPGTAVSENSSNALWYDLSLETESSEGFSFIFNDNSGNQTPDLSTGALGLITELWVTSDGVISAAAPEGWADPNRTIHVPGTFPGPSWDAASNQMTYYSNLGLYVLTFENVPAANYEFKIAVNGSWTENYGAGGVRDGANISVTVPETMDVTVYYSDVTHYAVTDVDYEFIMAAVTGTGIEDTALTDPGLTGVYAGTVHMTAGSYTDIAILSGDAVYPFAEILVEEEKDVTFYFDPVTELYYCNASNIPIDTASVHYDSQDEAYKAPFGAVAAGEEITFSIQTGEDVTSAVLVIKGVGSWPMTRGVDDLWSAAVSVAQTGEYDYYFALSNGSAVAVYGDDDGYYGTGTVTDLTNVIPYDLVVYEAGFETPDWMKNAVIYQIFPDRFFDGDESNNMAQTWARGDVNYEFITDWYALPENPEQEALLTEEEYKATGAYYGDGQWSNEIYGGDLQGVIQRIDYLKALGVNVIYLNPVFWSISNHRYDAVDYTEIDPILGTLGDFEELVAVAEANDMHIILDGVFNHVSDDSVYFDRYYKFLPDAAEKYDGKIGAYPYWAYVYDYMAQNGVEQSDAEAAAKDYFSAEYGITDYSYTEWFEVSNVKGTNGVYAYEGWWGYDSMPVIKSTNGSEYQTGNWAEEIIYNEDGTSVTQYWISKGNDGWRLDVANEVSDETWQEFRSSVKALDSEAVIIGEIWDDATKYLMGDMYDSVMNYQFRNAVTAFVLGETSENTAKALEKIRERYPEEAFYAMMNLVGSHDTTRIRSYLDGIGDDRNDKTIEGAFPSKENTAWYTANMQMDVALLQFTYPGAPTIYYGDEIGMLGADDPDDRRAFEWGRGAKGMVEWYAKLAAIRAAYPALRTGDIEMVDSGYDEVLAFWRTDADSEILVLANRNPEGMGEVSYFQMPEDKLGVWVNALNGDKLYLDESGGVICLGTSGSLILVPEDQYQEINVNYEGLAPAYDPAYIICDHVFAEGVVTEPTCTEDGYTSYACTLCEYVEKRDVVVSSGHTYVDGVCSVCGYVYVAETGTCGENLTWKFDQETGTLTISGTGEMGNYDEFGTIPWYAWRTQLTSVVIEEGVTSVGAYAFFDHALMRSITLPNTLEKIGGYAFNCCDRLYTVEIPASVVQIKETAFTSTSKTRLLVYPGSEGEAYAIERGLKYTVLDCSHTYGDGVVTEATCTEDGYVTYTCTKCGGEKTDGIPALGHTEEAVPGKAATCTETGLTEGRKCSVCGETLVQQEEIAALGHTEELIPGKPATCTETGLTEGRKCSVCGETLVQQEEIAALGHTEKLIPGKPATETETGLTEGKKCSVCGEILVQQTHTDRLEPTEPSEPTEPAEPSEPTEPAEPSEPGEPTEPAEPEKPCEGGEDCGSHDFEDVDPNEWYHEAVDYVIEAGLMNGTDKGFEPGAATTRAQLATMLWRLAGEPTGNADTSFTDLDKEQQWYQEAVKWAFAKDIINGRSETVFDPNASVTRQEMVTMFYRFAKAMDIGTAVKGDLSKYGDVQDVMEYAVEAMTWAVGAGLINGNDIDGVVKLDALGNTTRAQMATVLMRYIEEIDR